MPVSFLILDIDMDNVETSISDIREPIKDVYFNMMELFSIFLDKGHGIEPFQVTPSDFRRELEITSDERHKRLLNPLRKYKFGAERHLAPRSFRLCPEVIIFQNFIPGETYNVILNIVNCTEILKPLQMTFENTDIFTVTYKSKIVMTKVASGLSVAFNIKFCPQVQKDYGSNIAFISDKESFSIPIMAIGYRPLLDIPDHIYLPSSPVRVPTSKLVVIRNLDSVRAVFTIVVSSPFSVKPKEGILGAEEIMHLLINCTYDKVGDFEGTFILKYETGEELYSYLHGSTENANVYFDEDHVSFDDTFIGLSRHCTITLRNKSEHIIPFKWKKFATSLMDENERSRLKEAYSCVQETETLRSTKLETLEVTDFEGHSIAYERIYNDEVKELENNDFLFNDSVFVIDQLAGEIWPCSSISMEITFKPKNVTHYKTEAYCEIGGSENRLPLLMQGQGKGPDFQLNLDVLDISYIFFSSKYSYEVVATNKGHIPGTISFVTQSLIFGGKMSCEPSSHYLKPDEYKSFVLSFSSNRRGNFTEDVLFKIEESSEILKLIFKGSVITPTLHFDKMSLDWGDVPIGFPTRNKIVLHNLSVVPVSFSVRVLYDGFMPSLTYKKFSTFTIKPTLSQNPKEFKIEPNKGIVPEYSNVTLEISLLPNIPREWETALMVDMWDSESDSLSLPMKYNAKYPSIVCPEERINITFCFINCCYNRTITLENRSKIPGFFHIIPQHANTLSTLTFSAKVTQGVLKGHEKIAIPLTIMTDVIGKQSLEIYLLVMGVRNPIPCCTVICNGQGPVISVDPFELDWGETSVIKKSTKHLTLINDSPIAATFSVVINSPWAVEPLCGTVHAAGTFKLQVSIYLREKGTYSGSLEINLQSGNTTTVLLSAKGIGKCIEFTPQIFPSLDLGILYSHCVHKIPLNIVNKGLRHYSVLSTHSKDGKLVHSPKDTVFKILPQHLSLGPDESADVILEARCDSETDISENLYIFSSKGLQRKVSHSQTTIKAKFIKPVILFSKPELVFCANYGLNNENEVLIDSVEVINQEVLALNVEIQVDHPFYIASEEGTLISNYEAYIESMSNITITIHFIPPDTDDLNCYICQGFLLLKVKDHPTKEMLPVKGEINHPNVKLIPDVIDFGCILVGTLGSQHIIISNVSPLPVKFWWYWYLPSFKLTPLDLVKSGVPPTEEIEDIKKSDVMLAVESDLRNEKASSEFLHEHEISVTYKKTISSSGSNVADGERGAEVKKMKNERKIEVIIAPKEIAMNTDPEETNLKPETKIKNKKEGKKSKKERKQKLKSEKEQDTPVENIESRLETVAEHIDSGAEQHFEEGRDVTSSSNPTYEEVKDKLFPIIDKYFEADVDIDIFTTLPTHYEKTTGIDEIFEITPCFGTLNPHSLTYINVSFCGQKSFSAEAKAVCKVENGPSEILTIRAMSSNFSYYLETTSIDFGSQVSCDVCQKTIALYNTGYVEFDFLTVTVEHAEFDSDAACIFQTSKLVVEPKSGRVQANSKVELTVRYVPGLSGKFKQQFYLEIGNLLPIKINVEGIGVFPQLHISLPRLQDYALPSEIGYDAIASLSYWYSATDSTTNTAVASDSFDVHHISDTELHELLGNDWDIILSNEFCPRPWEIDLAIERIIAYRHIEKNPYILTKYSHSRARLAIPSFSVPPYLLDFGLVIMEKRVHFTVEMYNFGPVPICVLEVNSIDLERYGLQIQFLKLMDLPVSEVAYFHVIFNPKQEYYSSIEEEVNVIYYLEVQHGARIPIHIKAIVTVPYLTVSTTLMEYGPVKCGECKIMTLVLRNEGLVPCKWEAILVGSKKSIFKKSFTMKAPVKDEHPVFSIKHNKDIFNPDTTFVVEVAFQPRKSGVHQMILVLSIVENPDAVTVLLQGEGIEPYLLIENAIVSFPPVLPYPQNCETSFCIENPCSFPIEFYFPDFDSQIIEEERILKALAVYYRTKNLILPVRNPGDKLPKELYDFYNNLVTDVKAKLILQQQKEQELLQELKELQLQEPDNMQEQKKSKKISSVGISTKVRYSVTSDQNDFSSDNSILREVYVGKPIDEKGSTMVEINKTPLKLQIGNADVCSYFETSIMSAIDSSVSQSTAPYNIQDILDDKDPKGLESLVLEHIRELHRINTFSRQDFDPVHEALLSIIPAISTEQVAIDGVLIIFHGAPQTDYVELACKAARALGLLPLNLDQIIIELAAIAYTTAAMKIRDQINASYDDYITMYFPESDEGLGIYPGEDPIPNMDPVDELSKKVKVLEMAFHAKQKAETQPLKGKKVGRVTSAISNNKTTNKRVQPDLQFRQILNISTETLTEVLKQRFGLPDCERGIVIDGLKSTFFSSGTSALTSLLKAIGNVKYIQFVVLYNTFSSYLDDLIQKRQYEEDRIEVAYQSKMTVLQLMDDDEIDDLNEEDTELYGQLSIEKRKKIQKIISERLLKLQQEKSSRQTKPRSQLRKSGRSHSLKQRGHSLEDLKKKLYKTSASKSGKIVADDSKMLKKKDAKNATSTKNEKSEKNADSRKSPKSNKSSKISKGAKSKESDPMYNNLPISNETRDEMKLQFEAFEQEYQEILSLAECWDRRKGTMFFNDKQRSVNLNKKGGKGRTKHPDTARSSSLILSSQSLLLEDTTLQKYIGFPVWIGDCRNPDMSKIETIVKTLKHISEIKESLPKPPDWSKMVQPVSHTFCYATFPTKRISIAPSQIFKLDCTRYEFPDKDQQLKQTDSLGSSEILTSTCAQKGKKCKKRSSSGISKELKNKRSSLGSASSASIKIENSSVIMSNKKFKSRWILEPGEKVECKLKFFPALRGNYCRKFGIEIMGWKTRFIVTASGVADIPCFSESPVVIFPRVNDIKQEGKFSSSTYFLNESIFDFGATICMKSKEKKIQPLSTYFTFKNISKLPLIITFLFEKQTDKVEVFGFDPPVLTVKPHSSEKLRVWAFPQSVGLFSEILYCSMKGNPLVYQIKISCHGVKCEIVVSPKSVVFENVLLYQKKTQYLNLTNKTFVPVIWRFCNLQNFTMDFKFSTVEGMLKYEQTEAIRIDYVASKVQVINKEPLKLEVFEAEIRGDPLCTEVISVSADSYDVMLDIMYAQPNENHVNFGVIKMAVECSQFIQLQNKGKHEITYKIEFHPPSDVELPSGFDKMLTVQPETEELKFGKDQTVKISCTPKCELEIRDVPVFSCFLFDSKNKDFVISKIPINLTVLSHYSRYKISPSQEINFGMLTIGSREIIDVYIKNIGTLNFKYDIMKYNDNKEEVKPLAPIKKTSEIKKEEKVETKGSVKGGKITKSAKQDNQSISTSVFTIYPLSAEVKPSESATMHVECCVETENTYYEEIVIHISETNPSDARDKKLILKAQSFEPTIDFKDVENIFQEHYIYQYLNEFESPLQSGSHCVYAKEEEKLMFYGTCVGSSAQANLKIENKCLVPCDVIATLGSTLKSSPKISHISEVFSVIPEKISVPPYSADYFTIKFTPTSIETYTSNLEISRDSSVPGKKEKLSIKLCGEGNLPQVAITYPKPEGINGKINIKFPPTFVGQFSTKPLEFKNIGTIPCKIVLNLSLNLEGHFLLYPADETIPLITLWEPDRPVQHDTLINLYPEQIATIIIRFEPHDLGCFKTKLILTIIDNPFENISADIYGESFIQDLTFDGVELSEAKTWMQKKGEDPKPPIYHLNYGLCNIDTLKKHSFKITNHSKIHTYRFQWESHPNILFSPAVGHVMPRTSKDINATFLSSTPEVLEKVELQCIVARIKVDGNIATTAWDDRQTIAKWSKSAVSEQFDNEENMEDRERISEYSFSQDNSKFLKMIEVDREPVFEIISGSVQNLTLLVSALADYSRYACTTSELNFADTLIFQHSVHQITLKNIGAVPLNFRWFVTTYESYPVRPSTATLIQVAKTQSQSVASVNIQSSLQSLKATSIVKSQSSQLFRKLSSVQEVSSSISRNLSTVRRALSARYSSELSMFKKVFHSSYLNYLHEPLMQRSGVRIHCKTVNRNLLSVTSSGPVCVTRPMSEESDLFSRTTEMTDRSNDTWIEGDYMPFIVEPEFGNLEPNKSIELTVKFSPVDVFNYKVKLVCMIENLDPSQLPLEIIVNARSLMPYCHFDIVESDYVTSGRRNSSLPGPMGVEAGLPLDPETRTLEFQVLGVGVTSTRPFNVINPTDKDFSYSWRDITLYNNKISKFHCSTIDGKIESGKMAGMKFTFVSQDVGIHESFWEFCITKENIIMPFLLVGIVTEPSVHIQPSHLEFCPTVKGMPVQKSVFLVNNEDIPLNFNFKPGSLFSSGVDQGLSLKPMSGTLKPSSEEIIHVEFNPNSPGEHVFNVKCSVKRIMQPLDLFISGSCYKVQSVVSCSDLNTKKWNLNPNTTNVLDFGSMISKQTKTIVFNLTNMGKTALHYGWIYSEEQNKFKLNVSEKGGFVPSQSRVYCKMNLTFLAKTMLKDFEVILRIPLGPEYKVLVQGSAIMPHFKFSFFEYNFGPCFIQKSEKCFNKVSLEFTNQEKEDMVLECHFEKKPHLIITCECLHTVKAMETLMIPICFRPREERAYEEILHFSVDGSIDKCVTIHGEGVLLKIMLVNPEDKCVDFGNLQVDCNVMKAVKVVNYSRAPALAMFALAEDFPIIEGTGSMETLSPRSPLTNIESSLSDAIRIYPTKHIKITPQKMIRVLVKLSPISRLSPFTEKVYLQVNDHIEPLFLIKGSCFGADFSLDRSHLTFGAVVKDCSYVLKTTLLNVGDIGSRFTWNYKELADDFTVTPNTGYCSPGTSAVINVEFHPTIVTQHFVREATCEFENFRPLTLTLSGSCMELPSPKEVIRFTTPVRQTDKRNIPIQNRSRETWTLYPDIKGDNFSGLQIVTIPPNSVSQYEVSYSPLTMTRDSKHTGSIFFKLPDGQGLLYDLVGVAEPPLANGKMHVDTRTRNTHTELLRVKNWLHIIQRFKVVIELLRPEKSDSLYSLYVNEFINVPGNDERDYKFIIQVYKECNLIFKVMFINENGGEYQYYDLFFKVVKCGPLDVIKLNTYVRKPVIHELHFENPLTVNVNFTISCFSSEIKFHSPFSVPSNSVKCLPVEYFPLHPGEIKCKLDASCPELGLYSYELNLTATPPPYEKPINFTVNLGSECTKEVSVQNYTRNKADFTCTVDNSDFQVDKTVSILGNSKGSIEVTYDPSGLEGVHGILTVSSSTAGDFVFLLVGTCNMPRPLGPLILKPESNLIINFKNPFRETKVFSLHIDNAIFILKNKTETIKSKKKCQIEICLQTSPEYIHFPFTGKLIITCNDSQFSNFSWIYYLKRLSD